MFIKESKNSHSTKFDRKLSLQPGPSINDSAQMPRDAGHSVGRCEPQFDGSGNARVTIAIVPTYVKANCQHICLSLPCGMDSQCSISVTYWFKHALSENTQLLPATMHMIMLHRKPSRRRDNMRPACECFVQKFLCCGMRAHPRRRINGSTEWSG